MKKTLYSLMLSDDVVREIDAMAHRYGTNRSNLINQILAEHVDLVTPERRIRDIFRQMETLLLGDRELRMEYHRGILAYGTEEILISGGKLVVRVRGTGLELRSMNPAELLITGQILSLDFT